jgi:hypothetical protein
VEVVTTILTFAWLPTGVSTFRLWRRYLRVRKTGGDQWLLQLFCIVAALVTPVVLYISFASAVSLRGQAIPFGPILGVASALMISAVVPVMEIRMQMWINGSVGAPDIPVMEKER